MRLQLSKALAVAKSDQSDVVLCMSNFRTALMFPMELGGSALSDVAMQRLSQCPVADPPCQDQKVGAAELCCLFSQSG